MYSSSVLWYSEFIFYMCTVGKVTRYIYIYVFYLHTVGTVTTYSSCVLWVK